MYLHIVLCILAISTWRLAYAQAFRCAITAAECTGCTINLYVNSADPDETAPAGGVVSSGSSLFTVQSDVCPENCINRTCVDPSNSVLSCVYGCEDESFFGQRCASKCPSPCRTCYRFYNQINECYSCIDGHYLVNKHCASKCPSVCAICTSATSCTTCARGYYKIKGSVICKPCPLSCIACTSDTSCSECIEGYTGNRCERCTDGRYGANCDSLCPHRCQACHTSDICTVCKEGFFGKSCSEICPKDCKDGPCDQDGGTCIVNNEQVSEEETGCLRNNLCQSCLSSNVCEVCVNGRFGATCAEDCSSNCDERGCEKHTGMCFGCKGHYYGSMCKIPCPDGCFDSQSGESRCGIDTGNCTGDCVAGFTGKTCSDAVAEEYRSSPMAIAGGFIGTIIGIAFGVVLVLIILRYKRRFRSVLQKHEPRQQQTHEVEEYDTLDHSCTVSESCKTDVGETDLICRPQGTTNSESVDHTGYEHPVA